MVMQSFFPCLFIFTFIWSSCNTSTRDNNPQLPTNASEDYRGPIIDMHVHAFAHGHPLFGLTHPPTLRGVTYEGVSDAEEQKQKTLEKFRKHNIVKAIVTNGESWLEDAPETILIGRADLSVERLKEQFGQGRLAAIAEMAPFYAGIKANDPTLKPYFSLAQELGIPVGFHIFPGGPNYGIHLMPEMLGGMRAYNANPLQLEDVLVEFPNLKLYIMHGGWPYVDDIKALMYAHPNVYIDIAVVNWILPQEEFEDYLKSLINAGFGDRILYGSDQMAWPQTIDVGIKTINDTGFLTLEQKEDIFYNNAARLLGLSQEEISSHKSTIQAE